MTRSVFLAGMVSLRKIEYRIAPEITISDSRMVRVYEGDRELPVTGIFPLDGEGGAGYITLGEEMSLSGSYHMEIAGHGAVPVIPTGIFDSPAFADAYHYDGPLGAELDRDHTTFRVWAPTASQVMLNLFTAGNGVDVRKTVPMTRGDRGVWSYTEPCGHGTYYTYTVTTSVGTQEAVDPYAVAVGVNGKRGMVVDLALTNPAGFEDSRPEKPIGNYSEAIIWETHVRDFSGKLAMSRYRGKYLAFTERGLVNEHGIPVGVDYLVALGITHVHLLPVFDFATVDETGRGDPFNWGYDPENYNAPEGSYATDPYHGEVRIREYKQMVQALHAVGIGVIMDMVYNHTYDANNSLNKIVPYYYYRHTEIGERSSASGCGNDTASERYMFGRLMVDSTAYWVREYRLDGLRFDLMGLHDLATMQAVERSVHAINPHAILYGEGWTMGFTMDGSPQANQSNISEIVPSAGAIGGIAVFNDVMRDGLKGSVFDKASRGFINGAPEKGLAGLAFGLRGGVDAGYGWRVRDAMVINYMSAHDNHTLWDKLLYTNPDATDETRCRMNRLGAAILMLSRGTPFWQAGEELLRTKHGDENSYMAGDAVNCLDWSALRVGSLAYSTMLYYRGLIAMRRCFDTLTSPTSAVGCEMHGDGPAIVHITDNRGGEVLALLNPSDRARSFDLDGTWHLVADGARAGARTLACESGRVAVEGYSARIYVNSALAERKTCAR